MKKTTGSTGNSSKGIEFVGGTFHGYWMPEGELADTLREQVVVVLDVAPGDGSDDLPEGTATYHVEGHRAHYMASYQGLAN